MKKGFIYITTNNITGKKYIGKKYYIYKSGKESNWKEYLGSSKLLMEDINLFGRENFTKEILAEANTEKELAALEKFYIDSHDAVYSEEYYNLSNNVDKFFTTQNSTQRMIETRSKWSDEKKQAVSDKLKFNWNNLTDDEKQARINNMSKPRSDNFKRVRSNAQKKVWENYTEEDKRKISNRRSIINKEYWNNLSDEEKQAHYVKRKNALEKAWLVRKSKKDQYMKTVVVLINLKEGTREEKTINEIVDLGIPYNTIKQLLKNKYSTHNIYKRTWAITSI